jgi:CBS domain-containing protein
MKVKDVMTRRVAQISPTETLKSASELMKAQRASLLAVVDEAGKPAGVLTDRDIVLRGVASGLDVLTTLICDVMSKDVVFVEESALIGQAVATMTKHGIARLLITDTNGYLVGVIAKDEASNLADGELLAGRLSELSQANNRARTPVTRTALATISRRLGLTSPDGLTGARQ